MRTICFLSVSFFLLSVVEATGRVAVTQTAPPDEDVIRFVVMADRAGGMQPGVFKEAIGKANLLHPEFVISVGDLINGYTKDPATLEARWAEFDAMAEAIDVPFYYVPGNHDISNLWMEEEWKRRLGDPYYHFIFKEALFVALHTEDGGTAGISDEQASYVERVLSEHEGVRWTFLFMHRPLWFYGNQQGFERIDAALEGRDHTLFSGHHHSYFYSASGGGSERYILATSGGRSGLRGEEFGEFHHITHVALAEAGPKVALITLDGFVDKDIVNTSNQPFVQALRKGTFFDIEPRIADGRHAPFLDGRILLRNRNEGELGVQTILPDLEFARFDPPQILETLSANESKAVTFRVYPKRGDTLDIDALDKTSISVMGSYANEGREALTLASSKPWRIDYERRAHHLGEEVSVDEGLSELAGPMLEWMEEPGYLVEGWDWSGSADCALGFALGQNSETVFVAGEARDDRFLFIEGTWSDRFTLFFESRSGEVYEVELRPEADGSVGVVSSLEGVEANITISPPSFKFEVSVPKAALGLPAEKGKLRFNLRYLDHDRPENEKPSRLYWQPEWGGNADFEGSGVFNY